MQQQAKQFIDLLESQQLLSPDVLDELRRQVAESKTRLTSELLAKLLVDNGHLTKFQATKLITELKDVNGTAKGGAASTANADDDLGFAEDAELGLSDKSADKSSRKRANIIVDDDELDPDDVVDVVEVVDDDVVEVVEAEPVEVVEVVEAVEVAPKKSRRAVAAQDAFSAAPPPAKRVLPSKKSTANPYDSFRILGVGLLLALCLIAGFFLVNYFWRGSAEDRLKLADDAYEQRSYETAAVMYREFAEVFPANEQASYAKVRSALAAIRKDAEGAPDPKLGLETALGVLPDIAGEAAMAEQQSDLAGALIGLADKFNERADRTADAAQRKLLMADMEKLLALIYDPQYVGANQRSQQAPTLDRIKEDKQRIVREINRDEDLAKVLKQIDEKLAAKDTLGAYELRKALINTYPLLEVDKSLSDRVRQASVIERSLVKPSSLNVSLSPQSPNQVVGRSFILAQRSGKTASTLNGQVLFIKAKGSVYGIDGASGDILWRQFVGRTLHSEPLRLGNPSSADAIICLPEQGQVAKLTGNSGEPQWWASLGTTMHNPVAEGEDLFVATFDGQVASLDAGGGQLKWAAQLPQPVAVSPGVAFGKSSLYVPADHSNLFVLSRSDGTCQEVYYLGHRAGAIVVPPVMLLGQLFVFENVTSKSAKIRILATTDQGLELKDAQTPITMEGNIVVPPQIDGRHLIVQTDLGQIKVLDVEPTVETQKVSELVTLPPNVFAPKQSWLVAENNRVWVADSQLTRFDVQLASMNMSRVWVENTGDRFDGPPQLLGDVLIHKRALRGNLGLRVSAVEANTGKPIWETDLGMPVTQVAAAESGYIALNTNAMVFALGNKPIRTEADSNPAEGKAATLFADPVELADRRVVMLNRARGNQLAIYTPATKKMSLLAVNFGTAKPTSELVPIEDKVVLGLDSGQLVMLNLNNGAMAGAPYQPAMEADKKVQWNTPLYLADSKSLIVASDLQKLVRLSVGADLRFLNEITLENRLVGPMVALGDQICAVESTRGGDVVQFFDQTSLNKGTSLQLPGRRVAGPYAIPQASSSSCLLQIDSKLMMLSADGQITWAIDFPKSSLLGPPLVSGENLIVVTGAGGVWNIAAASGKVVGNLDAGQALSSRPLVASNNLLVGSDEGAVLAASNPDANHGATAVIHFHHFGLGAQGLTSRLLSLLIVCVLLSKLTGQDSIAVAEPPLIDQQPFDLITLNAANGGTSVKVFPLPFPDRQIPASPNPQDKLRVILVRFPEREYEVLWRDIERVELYEQRVHAEAVSKLAAKDFIGAFQNLSYLLKHYPHMPRLEELRLDFLLKSAADRYQAGELRQTLSALEELRATAPNYQSATVMRVLSQVADSLVTTYQKADDLGSAKLLLERLSQAYGATLPVVASWQQKLEAMALAKKTEAAELLQRKEYRRARQAATSMLAILPDMQAGQQIIEQINREHPMVRVGVMQRTVELDPTSLVDWSARRGGLLVQQPIFQFLETGAEGGRYGFALGAYRLSDDRQQLMLSLDPKVAPQVDAFNLTQILLSRADPNSEEYDPTWAAIFRSASIPTTNQVLVQLKRPNVLPHALLQWTLSSSEEEAAEPLLPGPYQFAAQDAQETSFAIRSAIEQHGQPAEVIEVFYDDPQRAVNDLLRGEVDVLDQLYPADAKRLATDPRVRIGTYALPTTHMLIPLSAHAYLANGKFRRALLYATDRQGMLSGELLNSEDPNDGRLISGPFPLGGSLNDPLAYAYNKNVQPLEYNPQLARLLLVMTQQELRETAKRTGQSVPKLEKLIIGCPDYEFARVAVQAMIQQWANVGIDAEMLVQSMEESLAKKCDLIYVTTTMWEPATDIQRLLGGNGIAATDNPFIVQALETLRLARNWREVRNALQDLHQLIDYHLPVLPLWQIADRFAVRKYVAGLEDRPLSLYQNISAWRVDLGQLQTAAR